MKRWFYIGLCIVCCTSCSLQRQIPTFYRTMVEKADATLIVDQHKYSMAAIIQYWKGEFMFISLQPLVGVEMARIEADTDSVWIYDKMNRRYTVLAYSDMADKIQPAPSFKLLEKYLTEHLQSKDNQHIEQNIEVGSHQLGVQCVVSQRDFNTLGEIKRLPNQRYERVGLRQIIPL